jgi:hypothetical protein
MARTRKIRSDCNYIIYEAVDEAGMNYIGLTRKATTVARSVKERWRKHISRARHEAQDWTLYQYLRAGAMDFHWEHRILEIVRGRKAAYAREREIVKLAQPTLNDQYL